MSGVRRTLNAKEFAKAMRVDVPRTVTARGRKVFLSVAARVHQELTTGTRVDTGFLRASIAAATDSVPFPPAPVRPTGKGSTPKPRQFVSLWPASQAQAVGAIAAAVRNLTKLSFAYGASYAIYDTCGAPANVERVKALLPALVRDGIRASEHLTTSEAADD